MIKRSGQSGAILILSVLLLVVVLGVAALSIDLGRLFLLKTELQNAADAAALAGARELNGRDGAVDRARSAASELLLHNSKFTQVSEILDGADIHFEFFCAIGSSYEPTSPEEVCGNQDSDEPDKYLAETGQEDFQSHYIRVSLLPGGTSEIGGTGNPGRYEIDLYFLPILSLAGIETLSTASTFGVALAGRHFFNCQYPPVMICNPVEDQGFTFRQAVEQENLLEKGDAVVLAYQANSWAPGNFAFLLPGIPGEHEHGAKALGEYLADPAHQECNPPRVTTKTGVVESWTSRGYNTRFDMYRGFNSTDGSPSPNVIEYPDDATKRSYDPGQRFGTGDWQEVEYIQVGDDSTNLETYFEAYYDAQGRTRPTGWESMSRYDVYQWELENGIPCDSRGVDRVTGGDQSRIEEVDIVCEPLRDGDDINGLHSDPWPEDFNDIPNAESEFRYIPEGIPRQSHVDIGSGDPITDTSPERRILYVAVIECQAENVHGSSEVYADTFAKFFALQRNHDPNESKLEFLTEFIGLAEELDAEYHVDVQLYE